MGGVRGQEDKYRNLTDYASRLERRLAEDAVALAAERVTHGSLQSLLTSLVLAALLTLLALAAERLTNASLVPWLTLLSSSGRLTNLLLDYIFKCSGQFEE